MGKLAKDMDKDSTKVKNILGQLISTLNTPSQQVNKFLEIVLSLKILFRFKLLLQIVFHH
jgi:hypothetical protein